MKHPRVLEYLSSFFIYQTTQAIIEAIEIDFQNKNTCIVILSRYRQFYSVRKFLEKKRIRIKIRNFIFEKMNFRQSALSKEMTLILFKFKHKLLYFKNKF